MKATARACSNIALIKYWGNRDNALRLPANPSISFNLADLFTETKVVFDPALKQDDVVIDEKAMIAALESGHLGGAGLDVFEVEPLAADSPLRTMEHVVVTPHMAAYSEESWQGLRDEMCETITDWIVTGWSKAVVNPGVRPTLRPRR
jgi:hypothetical protein